MRKTSRHTGMEGTDRSSCFWQQVHTHTLYTHTHIYNVCSPATVVAILDVFFHYDSVES